MNKGETLASLRTAFGILNRILTSASWTVSGLASELGYHSRQITRYLDTLEDFGVYVERDARGRRSSPLRFTTARLNPPFNALFLTREELLLLYAYLAGVHHAGTAALRDQLWEKVRNNLGVAPINGAHLAQALGSFDKAYKSYDEHREAIADLLAALYANHTCQVSYKTPDREQARTYKIEPYELTEFDGGLYLYCRQTYYDNVIVLAVERIASLKVNTEAFDRNAAVQERIQQMQQDAFGIFDDGELLDVKLKFTPKVAFYVRERTWHPSQKLKRHKDGSVTLTFRASGRIEIERWIRGWGEECEVVRMEGG